MTFTFVDVPFDNLDANPVNKDGVRFYNCLLYTSDAADE